MRPGGPGPKPLAGLWETMNDDTTPQDASTTTEDRDWTVERPAPQHAGQHVAEVSDGYITSVVPMRPGETAAEVAAEYAAGYDHGDQCVVCAPDEPRECRSGCQRLSSDMAQWAGGDVEVRIYEEYDPDDAAQVGTATQFQWKANRD